MTDQGNLGKGLASHDPQEIPRALVSPKIDPRGDLRLQLVSGHVRFLPAIFGDYPLISPGRLIDDLQGDPNFVIGQASDQGLPPVSRGARSYRRGGGSGHGAFSGGRGLGRGRRRLPSFLQVVAAMGTIGEIRPQFPGALGAGEGWRDRRRLPGSGLVDAGLGWRWYEIRIGDLALPA